MQDYRFELALRVREIRVERFGEEGIATLSEAMQIQDRTWDNYESGVMIPAWIILEFIAITGVEPNWLLTGEGKRYRDRPGRESLMA